MHQPVYDLRHPDLGPHAPWQIERIALDAVSEEHAAVGHPGCVVALAEHLELITAGRVSTKPGEDQVRLGYPPLP